MPTKTKTKSRAISTRMTITTTTGSDTATAVAQLINSARTPNQKGTATRRLKAYVAKRVSEGSEAAHVEQAVRTLCSRLGRGK